jgi:hypothetical protein
VPDVVSFLAPRRNQNTKPNVKLKIRTFGRSTRLGSVLVRSDQGTRSGVERDRASRPLLPFSLIWAPAG